MTHARLEQITAALQPEWERRKHGRAAGSDSDGQRTANGYTASDFRQLGGAAGPDRITPADVFANVCSRCPYYCAAYENDGRDRFAQSGRLDFVAAGRHIQKDRVPGRGRVHPKHDGLVTRKIRHYVRMFGRYGGFVAIPLALLIAIW